MPTEDTTEKIETELQSILARLTAEVEMAKGLAVEIKKLEDDANTLDEHVTASQKDIEVFMEGQSKELDTMIVDEQKEMAAFDTGSEIA